MSVPISLPSAFSGASCVLAAYVALSLSGFFGLQRWKQHRTFVFIAITGSAFCLLDASTTLVLPVAAHLACGRLQLLAAGLHVALWLRYSAAELGPLPGRLQRWAERAALGAAVVYGLPVVSLTGRLRQVPVRAIGLTLRSNEITALGVAAVFTLVLLLAVPLIRYGRASLAGKPGAWPHFLSLGLLVVCGFNDALSASGFLSTPHLLDVGVCASICVIGLALTQRWAGDIRSLDELSATLEGRVEARTQALASAHSAIQRADRLAAVGRLAGGMAHEINNPGAALIANLEYLLGARARKGELPLDAADTLEESLQAAKRITSTVRQLLLMSRAAGVDGGEGSFQLDFAARQAAASVVKALGTRVPIELSVPINVRIRGRGLLLEEILVHLLTNGVYAIPPDRADGMVRLVAECEDDVLVLQVIDNGVGMASAVQERLFEPFFSTRSPGEGAGLGLAVSLGLVQALGGEVRVESAEGKGTTMTLVLAASVKAPEAEGAAQAGGTFAVAALSEAAAREKPAGPRAA